MCAGSYSFEGSVVVDLTRRRLVQAAGGAALAPQGGGAAVRASERRERPDTPKLCLPGGQTASALMRVKQLGVDHVIGGVGGPIPWQESAIRTQIDRSKAAGLTMGIAMIAGFPNAIYGRPGRDEEIDKVIQSVRAAGRAGLPVIEYNWYAHRAMEGYFAETGRGGSGYTSFDYDRVKDLPPLPEEGAHSLDEMWANIAYFLKAVIPVAQESHVRLALHPNDPPAPVSRGSGQIMGSVEGWKRLIEIVPSPSNGITFDCGVTREMGQDPVEACRYFGTRDRINHVHFRNVRVSVPREKYTEVFPDEGDVDFVNAIRVYKEIGYSYMLMPDHVPLAEADPGSLQSFAFCYGYIRGLIQSVYAAA